MNISLSGEAYKKSSRQAVQFWVEFEGEDRLCRITYEALYDDYRQPGDADALEIFEEFADGILERVATLMPAATKPEDGEPWVVIRSN